MLDSLKIFAAIIVAILDTVLAQVAIGMNSVLYPLALQNLNLSNTMIGVCLSMEVFAIITIGQSVSAIISFLGLPKVLLFLPFFRAGILLFLSNCTTWWTWMIGIFLFGMATNIFLVSLQIWLNSIKISKFKGLVMGGYSAALSGGVALGPLILQYSGTGGTYPFKFNSFLCLITVFPTFLTYFLIPKIVAKEKSRISFVLVNGQAMYASALVGGITWFGLPAFLTIFGTQNGIPLKEASFLISFFEFGSMTIGWLLCFLSDFIDRRVVIMVCVLLNLLCAVYLPMAIFHLKLAYGLMFLWGGLMGGIYSICLTMIGERFRQEDQVSANVAYVLMDGIGGFVGVSLIGVAMDTFGTEGLVYVIVSGSVSYFIFALSKYRPI
ncbi:MAG: MFS transporter [Candidatus Riflebacteria bacterium]|nr:MFS transporter [Candidatus Riflebacteria bacterium]